MPLYDAAVKLGFTKPTGIEIGYEESTGLVGNEQWAAKGRTWGKPGTTPWIPEDMASMSIGQSVVQVTPLQLARAYAVFANGGYLITPTWLIAAWIGPLRLAAPRWTSSPRPWPRSTAACARWFRRALAMP